MKCTPLILVSLASLAIASPVLDSRQTSANTPKQCEADKQENIVRDCLDKVDDAFENCEKVLGKPRAECIKESEAETDRCMALTSASPVKGNEQTPTNTPQQSEADKQENIVRDCLDKVDDAFENCEKVLGKPRAECIKESEAETDRCMALTSASPVKENEQGNDQCDCSKPFFAGNAFDTNCPAGYRDTSPSSFVLSCTQIGCSEGDFEAQCKANKSTPTPAPPTATAASPVKENEQDNYQCDCSKNFHLSLFEQDSCPEGYADVSKYRDSVECDQIGCTQQDHNVQCRNIVFPGNK